MPQFSRSSKELLSTCHPDLIKLFELVVGIYDCTIICGHRGKEAQDHAYRTGASDLPWPLGNHNSIPSKAVDVAPYVDFKPEMKNREQITHFAGFVKGVANMLDMKIRWGGDWDSDNNVTEREKGDSWDDMFHFELVDSAK